MKGLQMFERGLKSFAGNLVEDQQVVGSPKDS